MWFEQCLEVGEGSSIDRLVGQIHHLESDTSDYREPVEGPEEEGHTGGIRCKGLIAEGRESSQDEVAVVEAGDDECLDQELRRVPREEGSCGRLRRQICGIGTTAVMFVVQHN